MKRVFSYVFFMIILSFVFVVNVSAECTYQERKNLLNEAKNVDISYEVKSEKKTEEIYDSFTQEKKVIEVDAYYFNINVVNLTDNLFIRYYNDFDDTVRYINSSSLNNGIYTIREDNTSNIYTYYFELRSNNSNCMADEILTKEIKKPKYNYFSEFTICNEENLSDTDYCKRFINKELGISESEFFDKTNKILEESLNNNQVESFNLLKFLKTYWYYGVGILMLGLIILIIIFISKKRGELV